VQDCERWTKENEFMTDLIFIAVVVVFFVVGGVYIRLCEKM